MRWQIAISLSDTGAIRCRGRSGTTRFPIPCMIPLPPTNTTTPFVLKRAHHDVPLRPETASAPSAPNPVAHTHTRTHSRTCAAGAPTPESDRTLHGLETHARWLYLCACGDHPQVCASMNTDSEIIAFLRDTSELLRTDYSVVRIGLFGSVARGQADPDSDIDILVELAEPTFDHYMDLKFFLEDHLGRPVDLVLSESLKPRIAPLVQREVVYA